MGNDYNYSKVLCNKGKGLTMQHVHRGGYPIIVVNDADYFGHKLRVTLWKRKSWDKIFNTNVIGYSNMVQARYPTIKERSM